MVHVYLSGDPVHDRVLQAFYEGCADKKKLIEDFKYEPSEVAVIFGVYKSKIKKSYPRGNVFRQQRKSSLDVVVLETGYINRGDGEDHHYAAGLNGLNGRADFRVGDKPDDRARILAEKYPLHPFSHLRPYSRGEKILLCGQVPWDASVEGTDHQKWLKDTVGKLKTITTKPIVFRPHPLAKLGPLQGCSYSTAPLLEDLATAHAVVTFNSNSGLEATMFGKSVFAADEGSMVWPIANRRLEDINAPKYPDRKLWLSQLAFCQWTPKEMAEGLAWRHLFR